MYKTPLKDANPFVIGILGGMGSYSTLHFFQKLLEAYPGEKEWHRPRILVDNNCILPSRVRAILYNENYQELVDGMASALTELQAYNPHAIAIPCNTAHYFLPEVLKQFPENAQPPIVDMLESVVVHCEKLPNQQLHLLSTEGTYETKVYEKYARLKDLNFSYPSTDEQQKIRYFIEQIKQDIPVDPTEFIKFINNLETDSVILGCTELSVLCDRLPQGIKEPKANIIDPVVTLIAEIKRRLQ